MTLGITTKSRAKQRWLILGAIVALATTSIAGSVSGAVSPSTFEGNDGNMVATVKDWANTTHVNIADASGSTDNTIGSSKEDDAYPQIVSQSAPPKDDFTSVHIATEHVGTSDFLYQASIRKAPNGSANENVELNQATTVGPNNSTTSPNGVTPWRTVGDKLITFDFDSSANTAHISILSWNTSSSTPCADANDHQPCWDSQDVLNPNEAEGAVNDGLNSRTGAITAADNSLTGVALKANLFQEMSVNLTTTGILPAGVCETFADTLIKSRSSGSQGTFNSDLKDLVISSQPITNCGTVTIHKQDDAGTPLAGAVFTLYNNLAPLTAPRGAEDTITTLTCTTAADGNCTIINVPTGPYWVVETTTPANHDTAADQSINVTSGSTVSLTFVDPRQPGTINIHKQDDNGAALAGAVFTLFTDVAPLDGAPPHGAGDTATSMTCTTAANGNCSITSVPLGQYWVVETTTPSGYSTAADQNVVLNTGGQTVNLTFSDPRQFKIIVLVCKNSDNSLYKSTVTVDGVDKTSLGTGGGGSTTDATLCALGGATYSPKATGNHASNVNIPVTPLP